MPAAQKHVALVMVNLKPGMDGASNTMLELMLYLGNIGYKVSIFNVLTSEPEYRILFADKIGSEIYGKDILNNDIYHYCEDIIDVYIQLLPIQVDELRINESNILKTITKMLSRLQVDYVLTVDTFSVLAAHIMAIPGCHFFHSLANIQWVQAMHPACLSSMRTRDIAVGSKFLQSKVKELLGMEATVLYPVIHFPSYAASSLGNNDAIGFYAGSRLGYKGDEIVKSIIAKMPMARFLLVGPADKELFGESPANVRYCGFLRDMKDFYRQIKIILVPSLVQEGFSRVILEAAANGIPAVANNKGGIPEALGDSGLLIEINSAQDHNIEHIADCYVKEIRRLFETPGEYAILQQKALLRARQYAGEQDQALRAFCQHHVQETRR